MSGPWENYQTQQSTPTDGPWAKYAVAQPDFQPKTDMFDAVSDNALQGATFGLGNRAQAGLAALVESGINGKSLSDNYEAARNVESGRLADEIQQHPAASIASNIGGALATGGLGANTAAGTALANSLRSGGIAARVGKGALAGAASGAAYGAGTADYDESLEGAEQGALTGAATGGVIPVAGAALGLAKDTLAPFTKSGRENIVANFLEKQGGGKIGDINDNSLVSGSSPTLGQSTGNYGLLSLERGLRNTNPADFANAESQNNAARNKLLDQIAGTPQDITNAQTYRKSITGPLYDAAGNTALTSDQSLADIANRPSFKNALARAQTLAKERGEPLKVGQDIPETTSQSSILGADGRPLTSTNEAQSSQYTGKGLHYVKMALDDTLDRAPSSGIGNHEISAIQSTKNDLLNWLDKNNPNYTTARQSYASLSAPINQMETLQGIKNKAMLSIPDPQTGYDYISQAKISRLFDTNKDELAKSLAPEQYNSLQSIVSDLDRASANNAPNIRAVGSDTAQNLATKNALSNLVGERIANNPLAQTALRPLDWLYKIPEQQMRDTLLHAVLNPSYAKDILSKSSSNKAISPLLSGPAGGLTAEFGSGSPAKGGIGDQNMQQLQQLKQSFPQQPEAALPNIQNFAKAESGNNPQAKNPNSSASGLYQFTNKTWNDMVARYGKQTGINFGDKGNPQAQATMAALLAKDNVASLQNSLGRMPTKGELYAAHVLGAHGASKLINANPNQEAIMIFPKQVFDANRPIFFDGKRPRTVSEVQSLLAQKVS